MEAAAKRVIVALFIVVALFGLLTAMGTIQLPDGLGGNKSYAVRHEGTVSYGALGIGGWSISNLQVSSTVDKNWLSFFLDGLGQTGNVKVVVEMRNSDSELITCGSQDLGRFAQLQGGSAGFSLTCRHMAPGSYKSIVRVFEDDVLRSTQNKNVNVP